ncbi:hypothetical protein ACKI2N_012265 [Cupriavidus sp. 30B13]|uniref:hypothetical protein n=1 Tax=Cupriavidus sp. 30B13 TaxID=3384241 RepID=UPI003B8F6620
MTEVLLIELSGSGFETAGLDAEAVAVPPSAASGGVGVLAHAASSVAHANTASNRPIFIKFSNRDAKNLPDAKKIRLSRQ